MQDSTYWSNGHLIVEENKYDSIIIYTLTGKELAKFSIKNKKEIDMSSLLKGAYLIKLIGIKSETLKIYKD